ncbi:MAG: alanine racemase [Flavobacteriaceae bacterium]|nr:alanine racemase [Bacteroidia bacterium]NNK87523.1 alanine racemase [Flavobacteriaceae bacterium]
MPEAQETVLVIDLNALRSNYEYLRSKIPSSTKFLAVVKAFGYGSDAVEIARFLNTLEVDYFAVAYVHEGVNLREAGIETPILVLHPQPVNFTACIENCLEPSLYNTRTLRLFISEAENQNLNDYPVHIKFNTGLNRLGFREKDVDLVVSEISKSPAIRAKSIFSHLAASEDMKEREFSKRQIETFDKITDACISALGYRPLLHMCNTSGLLNYTEAHYDMVRCGIGLYGFGNSQKENRNLKPIASLKTVISQIHNIEDGETVGYNRAYTAKGLMRIATLPIGHADGIGRQYGKGKGYVTIHGKKSPIIGNVCMDMIMVDVSNIECNEGDEVVIFDPENTAEALGEQVGTISYEVITGISQRIKRLYIRSGF